MSRRTLTLFYKCHTFTISWKLFSVSFYGQNGSRLRVGKTLRRGGPRFNVGPLAFDDLVAWSATRAIVYNRDGITGSRDRRVPRAPSDGAFAGARARRLGAETHERVVLPPCFSLLGEPGDRYARHRVCAVIFGEFSGDTHAAGRRETDTLRSLNHVHDVPRAP